MIPWQVWVIAGVAVVGLATATVAVRSYGHRQYLAGKAEVKQEWADKINEANERAAKAGHRYEEWKLLQRPKVITRTVEVERALQADPDWAAGRLPDGVRSTIEAAAADTLAIEPGGAVPAVRAAEDRDE